jgi:FMN phosphatase YigB (HAD superfamily)
MSRPHPDQLLSEIKEVHQRHGTSEYAFLLEELPSLLRKHPGQNPAEIYREAIEALRTARCSVLRPYPGVLKTLRSLKQAGVRVIAYTESMAFYTNWRIRRLGLDGLIDIVYSPENHDLPGHLPPEKRERYEQEQEMLACTEHRRTPKGELKPNPSLLLDIIKDIGARPEQCIYVGDKLFKDVAMARDAGVTAVHAKYGEAHEHANYELLKRVTHWRRDSVQQERIADVDEIQPSLVLRNGFDELLDAFRFEPFPGPDADRTQQENLEHLLTIWKKTIDVQEHFNAIEMQIRSAAITVLAALLGVVGFAMKEQLAVDILGHPLPIAAILLVAALFVWGAFFFMDRFWYHRLLLGAVKHGRIVEKSLAPMLPAIELTKTIAEESPFSLFKWRIHSSEKFYVFYGFGAVAIALFLTAILVAGNTVSPPKVMPPAAMPNALTIPAPVTTATGGAPQFAAPQPAAAPAPQSAITVPAPPQSMVPPGGNAPVQPSSPPLRP